LHKAFVDVLLSYSQIELVEFGSTDALLSRVMGVVWVQEHGIAGIKVV